MGTLKLPDPNHFSICDHFVLGFALWTIISNLTALTGGSLLHLIFFFFLSVCLLLLSRLWLKKGLTLHSPSETPEDNENPSQFKHRCLFWTVTVLAVCLTLIANRPDPDDTFYVNLAVAAADEPGAPILQNDTMHSLSGASILLPTFKTHSIEMLAAAISFLISIPAIYIFHIFLAVLAAMFTIFAYGKLFRIIAPEHWSWGVLTVFLFLCANGDVHRTYGNFSFVRLHQGKGMFLSVMVPLLITYSLQFARHPTPKYWMLLSSAQIASIGITSTALWVAPLVALLAILSGMPEMSIKSQVKRILLELSTSLYIAGLGLYIKLNYRMPDMVFAENIDSFRLLADSIKYVFGYGYFAAASGLIILTTWLFCQNRLARRLCLVFPLCVVSIFMNPLLIDFLVNNLTGRWTYWRFFWIFPLPTIIGIAFLTLLSSTKLPLSSLKRYGVYSFLLVIFFGFLPDKYIFSETNWTRIGFPGLKITDEYWIARALNDLLEDRVNVLVPQTISVWLTTFHKHPFPLLSRTLYCSVLYPEESGQAILALKLYIMGSKKLDNAAFFFRDGLQRYQVKGVCFALSNPWAVEIRKVLNNLKFDKFQDLPPLPYEIWISPEVVRSEKI